MERGNINRFLFVNKCICYLIDLISKCNKVEATGAGAAAMWPNDIMSTKTICC